MDNTIELVEESIFDNDFEPFVALHDQHFKQYDNKPFLSFTNSPLCNEEMEDNVFKQFTEWLMHCEIKNFLLTFEPKPNITHLSLGKCPFLHTDETLEEKMARAMELEEEENIKKELEVFVRKRLRLIKKLINVYKKAKQGIEKEYIKNLSRNDPFCECKKKEATKRIVDMMTKQLALEYLYLKSMKIKNEIEMIHCICIDTDRKKHLKNMHKYTLRTAEKLRCLLEKECTEDTEKFDKYFEEKTLRDMARMYLNEIETMASSVPSFFSDEWSSEYSWKSGSISEEVSPESEFISDIFETSIYHQDQRKSEYTDSTNDDVTVATDNRDDDDEVNSKKSDDLLISEEGYKNILLPEEPYLEFHEIKREILRPEYSIIGESEKIEEDMAEEDVRFAQLETNKAEIEILEQFKRELWLVDAFHYFTTKVKPELKGKFQLAHVKTIYDDLLINNSTTDDTEISESSIDSNLNNCLIYLNADKKNDKIKHASEYRSITSGSASKNISTKMSRESSLDVSEVNKSIKSEVNNSIKSEIKPTDDSEPISTDSLKKNYSNKFSAESYFRSDQENQLQIMRKGSESLISDEIFIDQTKNSDKSLFVTKMQDYSVSWNSVNVKEPEFSVERTSIPSFSGSLPDPLKKYRKCMENRDTGINEEESLPEINEEEINVETIFPLGMDQGFHTDIDRISYSFEQKQAITSSSYPGINLKDENEKHGEKSNVQIEKSEETSESICFPTLMDVIHHFTKTIKEQTSSVCLSEMEEVEEEEKDTEPKVYWDELINLKWQCPSENKSVMEFAGCEIDTTEFIEQFRKSNQQYFRNHPEMSALITLILRDFSMKRPERGIITFIRDIVFNKSFAKRLSSYLAVNNKGYCRRQGLDTNNCFKAESVSKKNEVQIFTFDKPSLECWQEWGVDYNMIYNKYGPSKDQTEIKDTNSVETLKKDKIECKDPWDLAGLLKTFKGGTKPKKEKNTVGSTKYIKTLAKQETKEIRKEKNCIDALYNAIKLQPSPDNLL